MQCVEHVDDVSLQLGEGALHGVRCDRDHHGPAGEDGGFGADQVCEYRSETSTEAVPGDGVSHTFGNREGQAGGAVWILIEEGHRERATSHPDRIGPQGLEGPAVADRLDQADSRARLSA